MKRGTLSDSSWDINMLLCEEEAAAVQRVLERDLSLRQADQHRVQRLQEVSTDARWLRGVSGQWFQEIQMVNQIHRSPSSCSPVSFSISTIKRKEQQIPLNVTGEEHTKTQGIPLRTRLTSLFSFRFPLKTKPGKCSHDSAMVRTPNKTERCIQLAVPEEVTSVETTHGEGKPEEETSGEIKSEEVSSAGIISVKYSIAEIRSGETVKFANEEVRHREISPLEMIFGETSSGETVSGNTLCWETISKELAHGKLIHKESLNGDIIPGQTTTEESTYRKAFSVEIISQKDSPREISAGKIIPREELYQKIMLREVPYMETIAKEVTTTEVIHGENPCREIIPGDIVDRKASAMEIIRGKTTTDGFENQAITRRRPSFAELIHRENSQRETIPREITLGEIMSMKDSPEELTPREVTYGETVIINEATTRDIIPGNSSCAVLTLRKSSCHDNETMKIAPGRTYPGGIVHEDVMHSMTSLGEDSSKEITSEKSTPEKITSKEASCEETTGRSACSLASHENSAESEEESEGSPHSSPQEHCVRSSTTIQNQVKLGESYSGLHDVSLGEQKFISLFNQEEKITNLFLGPERHPMSLPLAAETSVKWSTSSRQEMETKLQHFTVPEWLRDSIAFSRESTSLTESIVTNSPRECAHLLREPALPDDLVGKSIVTCSLKETADLSSKSTFSGPENKSTVDSLRESIDLLKESAFPGLSRQSTGIDLVRQAMLNDSLTQSRLTGSLIESTPTHLLKGSTFKDKIQSEESPQQSFGLFFDTRQTLKFVREFGKVESSTNLCPLGPNKNPEKGNLTEIPTSYLLKNSQNCRPVETLRPHFTSNFPNCISTNFSNNCSVERPISSPLTNIPRLTKKLRPHLLTDSFTCTKMQTDGQHTSLSCLSSKALEESKNIKNNIRDSLPNYCKMHEPLDHLSCWNHLTHDVTTGYPSHLSERLMLREKHMDKNLRSISNKQYRYGVPTKKPKSYLGEVRGEPDGKQVQYSDCTYPGTNLYRESCFRSPADLHVERTRAVTVNKVRYSRPSRHERMATGPELPTLCDLTKNSCQAGSLGRHHTALSSNEMWAMGCSDGLKQTSQLTSTRPNLSSSTFRESDSDSTTDDEYYLSLDQSKKETCL